MSKVVITVQYVDCEPPLTEAVAVYTLNEGDFKVLQERDSPDNLQPGPLKITLTGTLSQPVKLSFRVPDDQAHLFLNFPCFVREDE